MSERAVIVGIILVTLGILGGAVALAMRMEESALGAVVETRPGVAVQTRTMAHDWGQVGVNSGNVVAEFPIVNGGTQPLVLFNVKTSCMCTTAKLSFGSTTSPSFGMHVKSGYTLTVPPGETATLRVVFDPAYHGPSGIGPVNRQVTMQTNDPKRPELTFVLTAVVVQ